MKKSLIVVILIISLLCIGLLSGCGWHYGIFNLCDWSSRDTTFNDCVASLDTPKEIYDYMCPPNWTFTMHNIGVSPYQAWLDGEGDCKEWSIFATYTALQNDYDVWQISMTFKEKDGKVSGHVIPVFREGNSYTYIDIYRYYDKDIATGNRFYTFQSVVDHCERGHFGHVTKWTAFDECFKIIEQFKSMVRRR